MTLRCVCMCVRACVRVCVRVCVCVCERERECVWLNFHEQLKVLCLPSNISTSFKWKYANTFAATNKNRRQVVW